METQNNETIHYYACSCLTIHFWHHINNTGRIDFQKLKETYAAKKNTAETRIKLIIVKCKIWIRGCSVQFTVQTALHTEHWNRLHLYDTITLLYGSSNPSIDATKLDKPILRNQGLKCKGPQWITNNPRKMKNTGGKIHPNLFKRTPNWKQIQNF